MIHWMRRFVAWQAGLVGMELHYPEARQPAQERAGTHAQDGTPCRGQPWR